MKGTKVAAIIIVAVVIIAAVSVSVAVLTKNDDSTQTVEFTYIDFIINEEYSGKCRYNNDYFSKPSDEYNVSLATASLCFASASANDHTEENGDYSDADANIVDIMEKTGFVNIETNADYNRRPGTDENGNRDPNTVGVAIGSKAVGDRTLIALAVRSGMYEGEWAGNFFVGTGENSEGMHEGFYIAAKKTIGFLEKYIGDKKISGDIAVWMTGYSRGAAVANIAGGMLDSEIKGKSTAIGGAVLSFENLYVYTFNTPMGADASTDIHGEIYKNIFNTVDSNDLVGKIVVSKMGFGRYGVDVNAPDKTTPDYDAKLAKMLERYDRLPNRAVIPDYTLNEFRMMRVDFSGIVPWAYEDAERADWQFGDMLDEMLNIVSEYVDNDRAEYVDRLQGAIMGIFGVVYDHEYPDGTVMNIVIAAVKYMLFNYNVSMELIEILTTDPDPSKLYGIFLPMYSEIFAEMELEVDPAAMAAYSSDIVSFFAGIFFTDDADRFISDVYCLVVNMDMLAQAHLNTTAASWLISMDPKY